LGKTKTGFQLDEQHNKELQKSQIIAKNHHPCDFSQFSQIYTEEGK